MRTYMYIPHKYWSEWLSSASLFVLLLVDYCTILILRFPFSRCGIPPTGGGWSLKEFSMSTGIHFDRAGLTNYHLNVFHICHRNNARIWSKPTFHCSLAAKRTLITSSIQRRGHWCVYHFMYCLITMCFRWKVLILSASSQKPKGFQPAWGLASTFSPPTWPPSSIIWNSRQWLFSCTLPLKNNHLFPSSAFSP